MNVKLTRAPAMLKCCLFALVIVSISAEEKWSWSKGNNGNDNNALYNDADRTNVRSDVIEFQEPKRFDPNEKKYYQQQGVRQGRYEVKETTTRRPTFGKPVNDEFSGEVGGQQNDYGLNQRFGGAGNGLYPNNPYGFNPGFGAGSPQFGAGAPGYTQQGFGGSYGAANGVLVGPGGPTGIIGRPYKGFNNGYPGASYGPFGNNYGGFGNQGLPGGLNPYGGIGGGYPNSAYPGAGYPGGAYPGNGYYGTQNHFGPGQFGPAQFGPGQFGPAPFGPSQFGPGSIGGLFGGGPFGRQSDQSKQNTNKIEKRAV
ncbi:spidroin-2-like [Toxorhynchites rutilus septentrionalis]|uniref:spidroin-2-like n=1 Tax=Toxorhynchites rutilus septentrionalis TaxID=329112 RepID=UPI0024788E73|nr:spidroin-2-like [Toxorhynchites rutilus septentrionalis]XP_055627644.1 spidroin-2-like [Toxorhynchites rutilus septentrionalis]XP_055627646.1 spidroin-2-like [Toxorhynchites rutilus septentrionalis]XP_055627647.1 spidroin-2-like [Toxorhynchites rutilus septentrionalis]